jgi:anti-sigma factor ChrR (cupin superfamily)
MEPGAVLPYHEHVQLEQSFVLAGARSRGRQGFPLVILDSAHLCLR